MLIEKPISDFSDETLLFVYGTLMRENRRGSTYLENAEFLCVCTLKGFALYDLGPYPGIVKDDYSCVKGELYKISDDMLPEIDKYEEEGTLYNRTKVQVYDQNNNLYDPFVYVYNKSVIGKFRIDDKLQPWYEGIVGQGKAVSITPPDLFCQSQQEVGI